MVRPSITPPKKKSKRAYRVARWSIVLLIILFVAYLGLERIGGLIVKSRLKKLIAGQGNVKMELGTVEYLPPYGARAYDANFEFNGQRFSAAQIDLKLKSMPLAKDKKIIVKSLKLQEPALRLAPAPAVSTTAPSSQPAPKWSEMFELLNLEIDSGSVEYQTNPSSPPMVWKGLNAKVASTLKSASTYSYHIEAHQGAMAELASEGEFDVDSLIIDAPKTLMTVTIDNSGEVECLPQSIRDGINRLGIKGKVKIQGSAHVPINDLASATMAAEGQIEDGQILWPGATTPFTHLSAGSIQMKPNSAIVGKLLADYGLDHWTFSTLSIGWEDLRREVHLGNIKAQAMVNRSSPMYPGKFGKVIAELKPGGAFTIEGSATLRPRSDPRRSEFTCTVASSDASLIVTEKNILIEHIKSDSIVSNKFVDVNHLQGSMLGGEIDTYVHVSTTQPVGYSGAMQLADIDVAQAGKIMAPSSKANLSGRGSMKAKFDGDGKSNQDLRASGEIEILDGNFWQDPLLKPIVEKAQVARDALTASEGAATFTIKNRKVYLTEALLSAPVLGLEGSGNVDFDGRMDMRVIAAPLSDWREGLKETNIPILSNVVGEVAGGLQKIVNTATKTLLYEFHVTGDGSDPKVEPIPAPVLTEGAAKLFESVLQLKPGQHTLQAIHKNNPDETK